MEQALQREKRTEEVTVGAQAPYLRLAGIRKDFGSFSALKGIELDIAQGGERSELLADPLQPKEGRQRFSTLPL